MFTDEPSAALPRVRIQGRETPLRPIEGTRWEWAAEPDTTGLAAGRVDVDLVQRVAGSDEVTARSIATVSAPVYVVWTLDHEGYDEPDALAENVASFADQHAIQMTILFHPRVLIAGTIPRDRRDAIVRWVMGRDAKGDEIGMHLHMQFDYVRDAGVAARTSPRWGIGVGGDGYDVPLTAYDEAEQRALIRRGLDLMSSAGLPRPTSFRSGGLFADARTLRILAAEGFTADTSGRERGTIGRLRSPWTLPLTASPYQPSRDDANLPDARGLPILEVPNTAGNSFSDDLAELQRRQRAIWPGGPVDVAGVLDIVSHPSTFDARERDKVAAAMAPLLAARADRDRGPVVFVTLRELVELRR